MGRWGGRVRVRSSILVGKADVNIQPSFGLMPIIKYGWLPRVLSLYSSLIANRKPLTMLAV